MPLEAELIVRMREQLNRELPRGFLVGVEVECALPLRWLDQHHGDAEARDDAFDRATRSAEFETRRNALPRHRAATFDTRKVGIVDLDPVAQADRVDACLRGGAQDRNVDDVDEL